MGHYDCKECHRDPVSGHEQDCSRGKEMDRLIRTDADLYKAKADRIAALEAEVARLRGALVNINRKASPDPERTMSEASNDLYWCACEARLALENPDAG